MTDAPSNALIQALQNPELYDHPVTEFRVLETHISWVILTGDYAYKIKKPMDFGFLNFSTLDRRKHFCEEELRLNKRLADALYLEVLPISGSPEAPVLGGNGEPFEYAIRMRQFDQDGLFDKQQERGELEAEQLYSLAEQVAQFHDKLSPIPDDKPLGTPDAVFAAMQENFDQIRPMIDDPALLSQLDNLEAWTKVTFERCQPLIEKRRAEGYVRECHGDLHLANITVHEGEVTVFDCIEFSEPFRWIDVINDLAFLLMDLESRGESRLANRVLNRYLEYRGDFEALPLLTLYKAYRAMVRAKIALFTMGNPGLSETEKEGLMQSYRNYAQLAEDYSSFPNPYLLAMTGLSASGKSVISGNMAAELGLIRLRSDIERKRLHGLGPLESSKSDIGEKLYTEEANHRTYEHLASLAKDLLLGGLPVIVDAACLKQWERDLLTDVAENLGLPFALIHCEAPEETRRAWIRQRDGDASEATEELLEAQASWFEPLTDQEKTHTVHLYTNQDHLAEAVADRIRQHFGMPGA
ncbi:bifunctional aminoglycoside phosphotransferase/ATP-binding protein [Marinobacter sp. CHS3-4]|uniref:bifunctional aminoglycoside phosphotransferase/ATP-binding protein n=1 Tax=Marinobacter sp. CHS3-4 TaxID=3045174 RepID=UPI0024B4EC69|nr:bifunctional aminoglycoside phosphotransferase/ATP-binding protein [Marinobacter sp. CHS3-4]MDI9246592.1 AAA family ATPase [Marinobacter sp. CHS3-4]